MVIYSVILVVEHSASSFSAVMSDFLSGELSEFIKLQFRDAILDEVNISHLRKYDLYVPDAKSAIMGE